MWLWMLLVSLAVAGEWREQDIEPRLNTDFTAWTPGKSHWRMGVMGIEYGLLTNASIGVPATPVLLLGVANARAKVTAIQTPTFDASLQGSLYQLRTRDYDLVVRPVGWTGSWLPREKFSLHFGHSWYLIGVEGVATPREIGTSLEVITGVDITSDLKALLGSGGGVYAGAELTLLQLRLGAEYHLNRRDSLIVTSNSFRWIRGLMAAGVALDGGAGSEVEVGGSLRFSEPLTGVMPAATTISWQFSWERFHLRLGLPWPISNLMAYPQALELFWLLGPRQENGANSSL